MHNDSSFCETILIIMNFNYLCMTFYIGGCERMICDYELQLNRQQYWCLGRREDCGSFEIEHRIDIIKSLEYVSMNCIDFPFFLSFFLSWIVDEVRW